MKFELLFLTINKYTQEIFNKNVQMPHLTVNGQNRNHQTVIASFWMSRGKHEPCFGELCALIY